MLKDYEIDKPILETDRLIIRVLNEVDVPDLKEWLGRDEIYTYWGRKASKGGNCQIFRLSFLLCNRLPVLVLLLRNKAAAVSQIGFPCPGELSDWLFQKRSCLYKRAC